MDCALNVSLNNKKVRETSTCFARDKKKMTTRVGRGGGRQVVNSVHDYLEEDGGTMVFYVP